MKRQRPKGKGMTLAQTQQSAHFLIIQSDKGADGQWAEPRLRVVDKPPTAIDDEEDFIKIIDFPFVNGEVAYHMVQEPKYTRAILINWVGEDPRFARFFTEEK